MTSWVSLVLQGVPVDLPELRQRRSKFEMAAKALKTRFMRKPLCQQMKIFFDAPTRRRSNIHSCVLPAFFTTDFDKHRLLWICPLSVGRFLAYHDLDRSEERRVGKECR